MPFTETFYTVPMNLVIHFKTIVEWYQDGEYCRSRGPQNAYYHACGLGCLQKTKELEMVCVKDLYIDHSCFDKLTGETQDPAEKTTPLDTCTLELGKCYPYIGYIG